MYDTTYIKLQILILQANDSMLIGNNNKLKDMKY